MKTGYFLPIDEGGFYAFSQTAEASGWYQLDMPGRILPALPGIDVPNPDAQGVLLQAITDLNYCWSPSAAFAGVGGSFVLKAGGFLWFPGREAIALLCILLPEEGAEFRIQFDQGASGPPSWITQPKEGGGVPGEGTVTSINVISEVPGIVFVGGPITDAGDIIMQGTIAASVTTENVVYVMKNGNDTGPIAGQRNRLDLPFLTIEAALAVYQEGDELIVYPGIYEEGELEVGNVTIHLINAQVSAPDGAINVFYVPDPDKVITITSEGNSVIGSPGTGDEFDCLFFAGAGDITFNVQVAKVINQNGAIALAQGVNCNLVLHADVLVAGGDPAAASVFNGWANMAVHGDVESTSAMGVVLGVVDSLTLRGNVRATDSRVIAGGGGCSVDVVGNLECAVTVVSSADGIYGNIRGDIYSSGDTQMALWHETGVGELNIYGDISGGAEAVVVESGSDGYELNVYGQCYSSLENAVHVAGGKVTVHGDVQTAAPANTGSAVITLGNGICVVRGSILSSCIGVEAYSESSIEVYGDIETTSANAADNAVYADETGSIQVFGKITSNVASAVHTFDASIVEVHGDILSKSQHAVWCEAGTVSVWGNCTSTGTTTNANAVLCTDGSVTVYGNGSSKQGATFKVGGTGFLEVFGNAITATRWAAYALNGGVLHVHGRCESGTMAGARIDAGVINLYGHIKGGPGAAAVEMLTPDTVPGNALYLWGAYLEAGAGATYSLDCQPGGINGVFATNATANLPAEPTLVIVHPAVTL